MEKQEKNNRTSKKPWIIAGLSLSVLIGISGCGASQATSAQPTSQAQPSQGQTVQGQTYKGQATQGQKTSNPAMLAAMQLRRLQSNQQNALTSDQKDMIKPILQELISSTNPSQDFLKQKADAINAVLNDQQKSFLAMRPNSQRNNPNGNKSNENNQNANNPNGNNRQGGTGGNNQSGRANPQTLYQQILDSLK